FLIWKISFTLYYRASMKIYLCELTCFSLSLKVYFCDLLLLRCSELLFIKEQNGEV
ncbi:mCG145660, partial [Mus musculus]